MSPGSATSLTASDIQIGAVEIKNSTDDTRATVGANGLHVDVQSSVLPSGASTSANQTTGNSSLSSIDGKVPVLGQALAASSIPVILPSATIATLTPPAAITGFATSTKQDTLLTELQLKADLTETQPVSGTFFQATQPVSIATAPVLVAGTALIGKVGIDQATANANEVVLKAGTAEIGKLAAGVASIGIVVLTAETTKVIGTVNIASGQIVNPTTPTTLIAFVTAVTTAGTRVQLASNAVSGIILEAPSTNTGIMYIGGSAVSATVFGAELQAGQSTSVAIDNTNKIYIDSSVNGEKVAVIGS